MIIVAKKIKRTIKKHSKKVLLKKHLRRKGLSVLKKLVKHVRQVKLTTKPEKIDHEKIEHILTRIPGFDNLLSHGIPAGSATLVEGGPGCGKTVLCLQSAVNACKEGKRVLYMSFEEPERRLMDHMQVFNWNPEKYIKNGTLMVRRFDALDVARSVEALLSEAKKELLIDVQPVFFPKNFKPDIVFIDSLSSIASAFSGEEARFRIYMEQLFRYLERENITSFLIREVSQPAHVGGLFVEKGEAVSFLSDGIIVLYNVVYADGSRGRALEILKMRGENIKRKIVKMEVVSNKGIVVFPNVELKGAYRLT